LKERDRGLDRSEELIHPSADPRGDLRQRDERGQYEDDGKRGVKSKQARAAADARSACGRPVAVALDRGAAGYAKATDQYGGPSSVMTLRGAWRSVRVSLASDSERAPA
jgi:hypothetical protein